MNWMIETENLSKQFGAISVVENLTLQVAPGEVVAFLGPNGAGKTTTIRMLAGMISASSGWARVHGMDPAHEPERLHEHIGFLTETPGFYEWMSGWQNLLFFGRFYPIDAPSQAEKYLTLLGLWLQRHQKVAVYSKGMKQRLAIARALLHEPPLLFLDEPTAGLDPEAAHDLRQRIREMRGGGQTVFLCTHNLEEAEELSDRVAVFRQHLVVLDRADCLRQRFFQPRLIVELEHWEPTLVNALRRLPSVQALQTENNRLLVTLRDFQSQRSEFITQVVVLGGNVLSAAQEEHSLQEIYLALLHSDGEPSSGRAV
jgi:ABC-2 type transport system ATP-binding protein